jgi:hypothetical protein
MKVENKIAQNTKKPYEAPKLSTINLRPAEAVLGHCRTSGSAGPSNQSTCRLCGSLGS